MPDDDTQPTEGISASSTSNEGAETTNTDDTGSTESNDSGKIETDQIYRLGDDISDDPGTIEMRPLLRSEPPRTAGPQEVRTEPAAVDGDDSDARGAGS